MKKLIIGLLFLTVIRVTYAQAVTTFILVRHAEKSAEGGSDPDLKPEGVTRAESFAAMFSKATIDAVYSTPYKRTRNTVTPLANSKSLAVHTYSSMKAADLEAVLTKHAGGTIVIAGHSNTIPEIANTLVGEKKYAQFADDDYGNIIIVSVTALGKNAKVVWLRY
jgi:broad specificity phosphatase PhoE